MLISSYDSCFFAHYRIDTVIANSCSWCSFDTKWDESRAFVLRCCLVQSSIHTLCVCVCVLTSFIFASTLIRATVISRYICFVYIDPFQWIISCVSLRCGMFFRLIDRFAYICQHDMANIISLMHDRSQCRCGFHCCCVYYGVIRVISDILLVLLTFFFLAIMNQCGLAVYISWIWILDQIEDPRNSIESQTYVRYNDSSTISTRFMNLTWSSWLEKSVHLFTSSLGDLISLNRKKKIALEVEATGDCWNCVVCQLVQYLE